MGKVMFFKRLDPLLGALFRDLDKIGIFSEDEKDLFINIYESAGLNPGISEYLKKYLLERSKLVYKRSEAEVKRAVDYLSGEITRSDLKKVVREIDNALLGKDDKLRLVNINLVILLEIQRQQKK